MPAPGMSVEDFIAMIQQQRSEDLGADAEAADDVLNRVLSSGFGDDDDDEMDTSRASKSSESPSSGGFWGGLMGKKSSAHDDDDSNDDDDESATIEVRMPFIMSSSYSIVP
jgi:hypothetical protein